jgi:predicted transposase YdaD
VDYFFNNVDLHFRAIVVPDKSLLNHEIFGQDHDTWYYKIYFDMLKVILNPDDCYRIYLDIKDTRSAVKIVNLHDVLCNNMYDFQRQIIERVQTVHSHEIEVLQITDLLVGIISYANRHLSDSPAKFALLEHMRKRSGYELTKTTLLRESKVNLFMWHASGK